METREEAKSNDPMQEEKENETLEENQTQADADQGLEAQEYEPDEKPEGVSVKILTDMQRQIEELRREKKEQEDQVLRIQAEMQNLRRRAERDVEGAHKFALEKFVQDLLPVVDSLDRGIETVPEDDEAQRAAREGLVLTQKMLMDTLAKFSVNTIDPTGEAFDPQFHEAITMIPQPDLAPNTVMDTVQKGYTLNGRLVRPAMVVVSKA